MTNPSYLIKRGTRYYCRVFVPLEYQAIIGKKEIWKSLGVSDYSKACKLVKYEASRLLGIHTGMKARTLTSEDIEIVAQFIYELYSDVLLERFSKRVSRFVHYNQQDEIQNFTEKHLKTLEQEVIKVQQEILREEFSSEVDVLKANGLEAIFGKLNFETYHGWTLLKRCKQRKLEGLQKVIKRIKSGEYIFDHINNVKSLPDRFSIPEVKAIPVKSRSINFGALVEKYNSASEIKDKSEGVRQKHKTYQDLLIELIGKETSIEEITKDFVRNNVREQLAVLPKNAKKRKEFRSKGLKEIAKLSATRNDLDLLTIASRNDYLEHLSELFRWGMSEGLVMNNPTDGLRFKDKENSRDKRDAFTEEELNTIFSSKEFLAYKHNSKKCYLYWGTLISRFTGMRLGEIVQLQLKDIKETQSNGIYSISVNSDDGKKAKNKQSIREVIIPQQLVQLGFLEYAEEIRGEYGVGSKLFPLYKVGSKRVSDPFSKMFSRFLKSIKIKSDSRISFHSFRHSYRDSIRNSNLTSEESRALLAMCGWDDAKVHESYGSGMKASKLYEIVNKLDFGNLKIEHLLPDSKKKVKVANG